MNKGLNKVMLIGWPDSDPEIRQTPNGRQLASFALTVPAVGFRHKVNNVKRRKSSNG